MEWLTSHWREVLETTLAVLGAASALARLTPTESDDRIIQKIYDVVHQLGLTRPESRR